jgi:hypothetical protein
MYNNDSQNIYSSYYTNVLLENTISQLSPQDRAKLSQLIHLRGIIQSKTDMSESERENALNKINSAISNMGSDDVGASKDQAQQTTQPQSSKVQTNPDGTFNVGPVTASGGKMRNFGQDQYVSNVAKPTSKPSEFVSQVNPYDTMSPDKSYFTYTIQKGDNPTLIRSKTGTHEKDPSGMYLDEFNGRPLRSFKVGDTIKVPVQISDLVK